MTYRQGMSLRIRDHLRSRGVECYLEHWEIGPEGSCAALVTDMTLTKLKEGQDYPQSSFTLSQDCAQELIDNLWSCGFRPTQGKQSEGVTTAQAAHLGDMRAIAFAKLNIDKPEQRR